MASGNNRGGNMRFAKFVIGCGAVVGLTLTSTTATATAGFAATSSNNRPAIQIVLDHTDCCTGNLGSATLSYTINRGGKQIAPNGLLCTIDGLHSPEGFCGTVTTSRGTTSGTVVLNGLTAFSFHTYTVQVLLTDGGSASQSLDFQFNLGCSATLLAASC